MSPGAEVQVRSEVCVPGEGDTDLQALNPSGIGLALLDRGGATWFHVPAKGWNNSRTHFWTLIPAPSAGPDSWSPHVQGLQLLHSAL